MILRHNWMLAGVALLIAAACTTTPITNRTQFNILSESQATQMGLQAYQDIKQQMPLSDNCDYQQRVRRIGRDIVRAASPDDPGYEWEFNVFADSSPNAFALPGGKVGVNEGLFKVAENDNQLATVMAHEVAHALARHGSERVSQQMALQGGLAILAGSTNMSGPATGLLVQAATLGVILPFSRSQESEADEIGMIYMARAGYNLWRNFADYGGERPPQFLSTHPNPGNRIKRLQELMPQACAEYRAATGRSC